MKNISELLWTYTSKSYQTNHFDRMILFCNISIGAYSYSYFDKFKIFETFDTCQRLNFPEPHS